MRLLLLFTVLLSAALLTAGCLGVLQAQEEYLREFEVEPGTVLEVYNRNGQISIESWDGEKVEVWALKESHRGEKELEKVEVAVEKNQEGLVVKSVYLQDNARVSVQYRMRIPEEVEVKAVESSNGSIELNGVKGDAVLSTSNGRIEVSGVKGTVDARTSNGGISMEGVKGIKGIRTSNGNIDAEVLSLEEDVEIRTSNGSITLYLDPGLGAELEASTSNGSIKTEGLHVEKSVFESTSLRGRLGEGGPGLQVKTSNGSIELYAR